ncbi:MAG: hypothetical protein KJZ74_07520 [Gemmatimonadales bacterium]|nr:hypothetical protein [Gemmatimonadota bacterium]MCL4213744.1 hypothetical protein [Gemmatimonadales bacterium]
MKKPSPSRADERSPTPTRRPYLAPALRPLGQARDLTQVVDNMGARDGGMGRMRRTG